jgi:phosphoglycolate phosphatase
MPKAHVLFDLDGTLVDSYEGIAESLRSALRRTGVAEEPVFGREIMGPPLRELVAPWVPADDMTLLERVLGAFKAHYDEHGCRMARPFDGVAPMLEALAQRGFGASIVTNKRLVPARAIVDGLGWRRYFEGVHALDSTDPPAPSKAVVLEQVLAQYCVPPRETYYVGDRLDDGLAADVNGMPFAFAAWGCAPADLVGIKSHWRVLQGPMEVLEL